ncbi:MAG: hypothetical protein FJ276_22560 [Planctomycetes bacterium]|nr:hypothetical protein [Planctomycetota bacterium]
MSSVLLQPHLARVRRRHWLVGASAATAWALVGAAVLLLCGAWLDLLWELSPQARIATSVLAGSAGLAAIVWGVVRTLGDAVDRRLVRRMDRAGRCHGQVLTGYELDADPPAATKGPAAELTRGLARIAAGRAADLAAVVRTAQVVPLLPLRRAATAVVVVAASVGLLALLIPDLAGTQWARFARPFADIPPYSRTKLHVEPGDTCVVFGDPLEIVATASGTPVEQLEVVLQSADGSADRLPMFPESEGRWRAAVARVTRSAFYCVQAARARSPRYQIQLITVPRIEQVTVRVTPPAYTRQPAYEGPLPPDGIAGLPGTEVRFHVRSNRPLAAGTITVVWSGEGGRQPAPSTAPTTVALQPPAAGSSEVTGEFLVTGNGRLSLAVTDIAGQSSQEPFATTLTLLVDQRPFVRLLQPRPQSLATPEASLPVYLSAEDDYGVARVELFRSLNDSRPRPAALPVAVPAPRRADQQLTLPLADFRLRPGDTIKLFGRVEDNDPAGAKGSESEVITVQIISQEDFERMVQVREGLDELLRKYEEARRRLENLAETLKQLEQQAAEQPPDSPVAEQLREESQRVLEQLRRESEALRRLAQYKLPYDADNNLSHHVEKLAELTDRMAEELEKLLEQTDLHHDALARQLKKLSEELAADREQFQQQAMLPLEMLETVFPLMVDQSRFVVLVLRQMDLADRLAAFEGTDGRDDPARKTRMRDLEQEQRQLREELDALLEEINDHATRLPDDERFETLRGTALHFVEDVRGSGALSAMAEAETALSEFAGDRAHAKAREAAEILREFLRECEGGGMAGAAGDCLAFQPSLARNLGNTASQLLSMLGLGAGSGLGSGVAGMGGYSALRGGNVGLYGGPLGMGGGDGAGQMAEARQQQAGRGRGYGDDRPGPAPESLDTAPGTEAHGAGMGLIPAQYRQRVSQYFQRLMDELGE